MRQRARQGLLALIPRRRHIVEQAPGLREAEFVSMLLEHSQGALGSEASIAFAVRITP